MKHPEAEVGRLLDRVVGRLAHDLRNPLAVVVSNLRFLVERLDDPDLLEAAEESALSADRLTGVIDNAASIQTLQRGRTKLTLTPLDLRDLRRKIDAAIGPTLGSRRLEWECDDTELETDAELMRRVLTAVVDHCVRRSPPGSVIKVRAVGAADLVLQIIDAGAPFAPGHTPSILSDTVPVAQRAGSEYRSDEGLGLHFAGVAARALGAKIDVRERSDGQRGVVFELHIPASPQAG